MNSVEFLTVSSSKYLVGSIDIGSIDIITLRADIAKPCLKFIKTKSVKSSANNTQFIVIALYTIFSSVINNFKNISLLLFTIACSLNVWMHCLFSRCIFLLSASALKAFSVNSINDNKNSGDSYELY